VSATRQAYVAEITRVDDGAAFATERRMSVSTRWALRLTTLGLVIGSEVVAAVLAGIGGLRLAIVAAAGGAFWLAYAITPPPSKCHHEPGDVRPVLGMIAATAVAIGATGGLTSPLLVLLPAPLLVGWTLFRRSTESRVIAALVPVVVVALAFAPPAQIQHMGLLAGWSAVLAAWMIALRVGRLFEAMRGMFSSLDRVRNGALSDAHSRRRGLETMTTKLAHELKNPLAAIKSLVQLELRAEHGDRARRRLEVVFSEAERMAAIISEYLQFARPVDELHAVPVALDELMEEVRALLAGRAEATGVELILHGTRGTVVADSRLLKEALVNVASNALEATPRGGLVDVHYRVGARGASITVRDTGRGMSAETQGRIGTPFFTTRDGGTGLGVVLAKTAIAQHRGTLEYASTPGVGTVATITLPGEA
jgi:signal transduction histidine kinase